MGPGAPSAPRWRALWPAESLVRIQLTLSRRVFLSYLITRAARCSCRGCKVRHGLYAPRHRQFISSGQRPRPTEPHASAPSACAAQASHILPLAATGVASPSEIEWYRPTRSDPYPLVRTLIRSNADIWKQYVQHDFVKQLGQGILSRERFIHFIKCAIVPGPLSMAVSPLTQRGHARQDYLYLKYYARANGYGRSHMVMQTPTCAEIPNFPQTLGLQISCIFRFCGGG